MLLPIPFRLRRDTGETPLSPMPRGVVLLLHAGYWAMYLLLMALIFALVQAQTRSPMGLVTLLFRSRLAFQLIVPNVVAFYIAYGILAPRFLATRRFGAFILGGLVALLSASAVSLAGVPSRILDPSSIYIAANRITPFLMATGGIAAIHVTIATIMRGFVGWYDDFAERDALRRRTTEMEVALMRATLDPHFLFNTLNNIDTLITRAPETACCTSRASRSCCVLSSMIRVPTWYRSTPNWPSSTSTSRSSAYACATRTPSPMRCAATDRAA